MQFSADGIDPLLVPVTILNALFPDFSNFDLRTCLVFYTFTSIIFSFVFGIIFMRLVILAYDVHILITICDQHAATFN
jgi:hypothetical protein